jgi:hypothetical protein
MSSCESISCDLSHWSADGLNAQEAPIPLHAKGLIGEIPRLTIIVDFLASYWSGQCLNVREAFIPLYEKGLDRRDTGFQ